MLRENRLKKILCIWLYGLAFLTATLGQYAAAETELKFENTVLFGDDGNQVGNAVEMGENRLYTAGVETVSNSKSLSVSYLLSLSGGSLTNFLWQYTPDSADMFNDIAVTNESLYFAGRSVPKVGAAGGMLAKFPLQASGSTTAAWAVKPQFLAKATDGSLQTVLAQEEFIYAAGNASNSDANSTAVLAKYDRNGAMLWSKTLSETKDRNKGAGTAIAGWNEFIYVAGYTGTGGKSVEFSNIPLKLTLWKYDSSGKQIWKKESVKLYSKDEAKVDLVASGEYLYVTALKNKEESGSVLMTKYDAEGNIVWDTEWPAKPEKLEDKITLITVRIAAGNADRVYVAGQAQRESEKDLSGFLLEVDKEYGFILASHNHSETNFDEKILGAQVNSVSNEVFLVGSKVSTGKSKDKKFADSDLMLLRFVPLPVVQVKIDMNPPKPAEESLKKGKKEKEKKNTIPVAILSTSELNAPVEVKQASLSFGRTGNEVNWDSCTMKDMNADGKLDLLCYFNDQIRVQGKLTDVIRPEDTEGILKGQTNSGSRIKGIDSTSDLPVVVLPVIEEAKPVVVPQESAPVVSLPPSPEPVAPVVMTPAPTQSTTQSAPTPASVEPIVLTTTLVVRPVEPNSVPLSTAPIVSEPVIVSEPMSSNVLPISGPIVPPTTQPTLTASFEPMAPMTNQSPLTSAPHVEPNSIPMEPQSTFVPPIVSSATTPPLSTNSYSSSASTKYVTPLMPMKTPSPSPMPMPTPSPAPTPVMTAAAPPPEMKTFTSSTSSRPSEEPTRGKTLRSEPLEEEPDEEVSEPSLENRDFSSKPTESLGLAKAYSDMGRSAMKMRQPAKAIEYYKEALQHAPTSAEIHTNLGLALLETNQLVEARDHFTEALKIDPNDSSARNNLEIILLKLKL